jgi:virulence-associated protein VapD
MKKTGLLCLAISLAIPTACSSKFNEADVQRTETDIRTQFEQKGFVVEQVSLVKDSDRHMTGFARVHKPGLLLSKLEVTKNCKATMDADSGKSIWECK